MPDQPAPNPATDVDTFLRRWREFVASGIAIVIVIAAIAMLVVAFGYIGRPPEVTPEVRFSQVKDLLQYIFPIFSFILGYYFNKVSTEARAENAESTAKTAVVTAQQATKERDQAMTVASNTNQEIQQVKEALVEVGSAAETLMNSMPDRVPGTMRDSGESAPGLEATRSARRDLESAWTRAKKLVN
jgi:hypothetical protein